MKKRDAGLRQCSPEIGQVHDVAGNAFSRLLGRTENRPGTGVNSANCEPISQTDFPDLTPCPGCLGSGEFRSCIDGECAHANLGCPDCAQTCPLCGGMGRV